MSRGLSTDEGVKKTDAIISTLIFLDNVLPFNRCPRSGGEIAIPDVFLQLVAGDVLVIEEDLCVWGEGQVE